MTVLRDYARALSQPALPGGADEDGADANEGLCGVVDGVVGVDGCLRGASVALAVEYGDDVAVGLLGIEVGDMEGGGGDGACQ